MFINFGLSAIIFLTAYTLGGSPGKSGGGPSMAWQLCLSRSTGGNTDCHICQPVGTEWLAIAGLLFMAAIPTIRKIAAQNKDHEE